MPTPTSSRLRGPTFFFFRITFTPSTETIMLTFFFLMFLALNSYCRRERNSNADNQTRDGQRPTDSPRDTGTLGQNRNPERSPARCSAHRQGPGWT